MKKPKISQKFIQMSEVYKSFSDSHMDFSQPMLEEMYVFESTGKGALSENNGYALGKRNINITVTDWKADLENGYLFLHELYEDPKYPHWFLDSVLTKYQHRPKTFEEYEENMEHWKRGMRHKARLEKERIERKNRNIFTKIKDYIKSFFKSFR